MKTTKQKYPKEKCPDCGTADISFFETCHVCEDRLQDMSEEEYEEWCHDNFFED